MPWEDSPPEKRPVAGGLRSALWVMLWALLAACGLDLSFVGPRWSPDAKYHVGDYPGLIKNDGEDLRILQFTDTHVNAYYETFEALEKTYAFMTRLINEAKPDLLVLTGDNIGNNIINPVWAQQLVVFLDSFGIPYALVMGNHDGDFIDWQDSNQQLLIGEIFSRGRHSLFASGPENVSGLGNYGIHILNGKRAIIYSLILMDSNRDYIRRDQVDWYEWYVRGVNNASGPGIKSLVFFHIPPPEIELLRQEMQDQGQSDEAGRSAEAAFAESPTPQSKNTGLFERAKLLGSTTHLFFGHDHLNALDYIYQDIHFVYGLKTGYCAYHDPDRLGAVLITLSGASAVSEVKVEFKYLK
jgi:hypothetical protein